MEMTLVGAGYRPELHRLFDPGDPAVECAELIANRYFADGADGSGGGGAAVARPWELDSLAGMPILVHGLSGNVASAIGPSTEYLESIARLADHVDALIYSDHLAFTAAPGRDLGHLAPNRFDDELLGLACDHIERMVDVTGRRVCLENLATTTTISGSTYTPEEFYLALLEASDAWDCLVDLTNIWINGQNRPVEPLEWIRAIPPERIRYVHLAGGQWVHGELIDSHSESVHPEVYDLLAHLLTTATPEVVIVERDSNWLHALQEVEDNVRQARKVCEEAALTRDARPGTGRDVRESA
jgi:uncharacterized protein (UPF0276 family)